MRHYDTLGVLPTATLEEIQKAYRKKVLEYHPDRNPGDSEAPKRFMEIQDAYEALTRIGYKPQRRAYEPQPRQSTNDWIRDAPPPTHDLWGNPIRPEEYKEYEIPRRRPVPVVRKEPEVDLWVSMETKTDIFIRQYWQEYNRLKISMAYEEPEKFWEALEVWKRNNKV